MNRNVADQRMFYKYKFVILYRDIYWLKIDYTFSYISVAAILGAVGRFAVYIYSAG